MDIVETTTGPVIYYDGECPFCSDYVRYLRLQENAGRPQLIDVRQAPEARAELESEGFDLDKGMVADIGGQRYEGGDALNALALLTTRSGIFNRITAALFSRPMLSRLLYPLLRAGRNGTLTLLGRSPFNGGDAGWMALFQIFTLVFGLFAITHFLINAFRYSAFEVYPSSWIMLFFGAGLVARPGSRRIFLILLGAMIVDAWLRLPLQSNHTIIKNMLLLAFIGSGIWHALKGSRWSDFFQDVVPIARVLLLTMYFYGVFHKINTGFLDPSVSCAIVLWNEMPWPIPLIDHPVIQYMAIYGTLVVETAIIIMLLVPRLRHLGILLGIAFHGFLAFSGHDMYPAFSTLTIALHVLFLSPEHARKIVAGQNFQAFTRRMRSWPGIVLLVLVVIMISWFALLGDYRQVATVWLPITALIMAAILFPGRPATPLAETRSPDSEGKLLWSRLGWLNAIGIFFFISCAMPYAGLKTAQTVNMFSNLRLEGGVNNHLIMRGAPMPFGYLDDLAEIQHASGDPVLVYAAENDYGLVYYHLLDRLRRFPDATVNYTMNDVTYVDQTAETLADDMRDILHPEWFRKWFHFQWVRLGDPAPCT